MFTPMPCRLPCYAVREAEETVSVHWRDIDLDAGTWTISETVTKVGADTVILSPEARQLRIVDVKQLRLAPRAPSHQTPVKIPLESVFAVISRP